MMKLTNFLAAATAAAMILASCSNEETAGGGKDGDGETTYAGVNLTLPASVMRTRADDPAAGIAGEKDIFKIGVYIVDQSSGRFDYQVLDKTDFSQNTNGSSQEVYTAQVAIKTVTGMKKIFVVANPTTALQSKLTAVMGAAMNSVAFGLPESSFMDATGNTLTSMVMSGAYTATGGVYDMTTPQSEVVALSSPAEVTISRNLAKVVVQEAADYAVIGGTTTLEWTLVAKANDAYFLRQSGTLYGSVPSGAAGNSADAYWSNFTGLSGSNYISVLPYGTGDKKDAAYNQSKYAFENKPADMYQGNSTAARIKGKFVPTVIYDDVTGGVPQPGTIDASGDFYLSKIDGTYWTEDGRDAAVAASYNGHTANSDFTYYGGGVGYYSIYVNDGSVKGVDRNGYYLLQVREVRGPGSPGEPTDPTIPVEDDTYLGVEVTVLNWDFSVAVEDIQ